MQAWHVRVRRRHRPRASDRARDVACAEAVPVPTVGREPLDLDVDTVPELGRRGRAARGAEASETLVVGELPRDVVRLGRQASARLERAGREACPEHDAARVRVPGGDAERERIGLEPRRRPGPGTAREERRGAGRSEELDDLASGVLVGARHASIGPDERRLVISSA